MPPLTLGAAHWAQGRIVPAARHQVATAGPLFVGTVINGIASYATVLLSARVLGVADFGLLGALLALVTTVTVLLRPLHTAATDAASAAGTPDGARSFAGRSLAAIVGAATCVLVLSLAAQREIAAVLHVTGDPSGTTVMLVLLLASTVYAQVSVGVLLGLQRFRFAAGVAVLDAGLRAVCVLPLADRFGVPGALGAYVIGTVVANGVALGGIGGPRWRVPAAFDAGELLRVGGHALTLTLTIAALQGLDLVLLRTYADPLAVGWYAAAASIANLLYVVSSPVSQALYPTVARARLRGESARGTLVMDVALIVAVGGLAAGVAAAGGEWLLPVLLGESFGESAPLLPWLLAKSTALALLLLVGQYVLALRRAAALWLACVPATLGLLCVAVGRPSPGGAAALVSAAAGLGVVLPLLALRRG